MTVDLTANASLYICLQPDSGIHSPAGCSDSVVVDYYFEFPSELCGLLIGFKGRKVAVLEGQTKTSITLLDRTPEPGMKMIHVAGKTAMFS